MIEINNLKIKKIENIKDFNEYLNIRNIVFCKEQGVLKEIEIDNYDSLNSICDHFFIQYKNENIGTIRILYENNNVAKLQRFCILKPYRGKKFGENTLKLIEDYCKNNNIKKLHLDAQYYVHKLYEKCGYKVVSDVFLEANIKHVKMEKIFM